jgi:peptidoglycan/LPS O-acetylase OafA/YrhL
LVLIGADLLAHLLFGQSQFSLPFRWALLRAFPLFVTGLLLARLVQTAALAAWAARAVALCGAAAFAINAAASGPDIVGVLAIAAVIVGCGTPVAGPRWPLAEWGAKISFSLFITHSVTAALYTATLKRWLLETHPGQAGQWAIWIAGLALALAAAAAFHHLVDEPIQRRLRGWLFSPRPVPHPAPARSG